MVKRSTWSQEKRLEFIDFRLCWDGQINRSDITGFFGISVPQASQDISRYNELTSDNAVYDTRAKVYRASDKFAPAFESATARHYLNELLAMSDGLLSPEASFIGWQPPFAAVPMPERKVPSDILLSLFKAIRRKQTVNVIYLSKNEVEPGKRWLTPHAIAHDGLRWHVRAYCHKHNGYRDFVVARFLEVGEISDADISMPEDHAWNNMLTLILIPNPQLSSAHQNMVELEYGMTNGELEFPCREALFYYVSRRLGLHRRDAQTPREHPVVLKNYDELHPYMPSVEGN